MEIDGDEALLQRKQSAYLSLDEKFEIRNETYRGQQYSQIYFARLHLMRTLLYSLVPNWKPSMPVCTVLGLEEGKECIIVGTLYKHMKLKPSILDEYSKERSATPLVKPHNFLHPNDHLVLEDESGRVKLSGSMLLPSAYVTGLVVALHGKETVAGDFLVLDILEAGLAPQTELPFESREDKYVVLVSGLSIGSSTSNPLQFQLLVDHITGHLGDEKEQDIASQMVHVIIAGNSVEIPHGLLNGQNSASKDHSIHSDPIQELDILLTQIAAGVPVDIMPGANDPANFSLPQQALNRCLFPGSAAYNTFRSCTNPHCFELDNIRFLGTSGQNIDDLQKYSDAKDQLEFMERTLRWRHLAPTAPNTLGCYPFTDRDPFLIESCPHVYFVGNLDKYDTCLLKGSEGQLEMNEELWDRSNQLALFDNLLWCKDLEKHSYGDLSFAVVQANEVIEDHSQVEIGRDATFFGVYDGHGGPEASRFICDHLFLHVMRLARENGAISEDILRSAFSATEDGFLTLVRRTCGIKPLIAAIGSCCLVGIIWRGTLYVANVGDSRAVIGSLGRSNKIVVEQLTRDHNASMEEVRQELKSLHPDDSHIVVMKHGVWRIKGIIQVSRSIGDAYLKQPEFSLDPSFPRFHLPEPIRRPVLTAEPSVCSRVLQRNDKFLIFASDGLWEHLTNQEAAEIVHNNPRYGAARRLLETALNVAARKRDMSYDDLKKIEKGVRRFFHDDITVVVIFIDHDLPEKMIMLPELSMRGFIDAVGPSKFSILQGLDTNARSYV